MISLSRSSLSSYMGVWPTFKLVDSGQYVIPLYIILSILLRWLMVSKFFPFHQLLQSFKFFQDLKKRSSKRWCSKAWKHLLFEDCCFEDIELGVYSAYLCFTQFTSRLMFGGWFRVQTGSSCQTSVSGGIPIICSDFRNLLRLHCAYI